VPSTIYRSFNCRAGVSKAACAPSPGPDRARPPVCGFAALRATPRSRRPVRGFVALRATPRSRRPVRGFVALRATPRSRRPVRGFVALRATAGSPAYGRLQESRPFGRDWDLQLNEHARGRMAGRARVTTSARHSDNPSETVVSGPADNRPRAVTASQPLARPAIRVDARRFAPPTNVHHRADVATSRR
jgi:hypothetical protein